jgi:DNA polymerase-4
LVFDLALVRGTYQINMFEDTEEMLSLYQAMDRMKNAMVLML